MKHWFLFLSLLSGLYLPLSAQSTTSTLYCVWETVSLREGPGKTTKSIGVIRFGEAVSWAGISEYVADESRTYLKVQAVDGMVGWIHEYLFVKGIGLGVVLDGGLIYKRPKTVTTITTDNFSPGELVIVENISGNWVGLTGKRKQKSGWIEGRNKVSLEDQEVLFASLLMSVEEEKDPAKRRTKMELVYQQAQQAQSPMARVIQMKLNPNLSQSSAPIASVERSPAETRPIRERPMPLVDEKNTQRYFRTVTDPETGQIRREVVETGDIYLVEKQGNARSIYFAYHKSLPIGSFIKVQIPGTDGYVELEVVQRLRSDNSAIVGLHPDCLQAIFGDYIPREISIIYSQDAMKP